MATSVAKTQFFHFLLLLLFLLHKTVFHGHSCKRTLTRVQWVSLNMHAQLAPFRGWSTSGPVEPSEWSLSLKQWGCVVSAIRVPKNEEEDWGRRGGTVPESVGWKQLKPEEADPRNVWFFPNFFSAHFNKTDFNTNYYTAWYSLGLRISWDQ